MKINNPKKFLAYFTVVCIVIFNLYLYRNEFKVQSDPNDNIFQYALIDEAKSTWKHIFSGKLPITYIFDNWNERWAEGFPLSLYYSHLPQAAIALISLVTRTDTYKLFIIIRTSIYILLPLSFFLATRILDLPLLFGTIVAFFSQVIVTDGLYGIDSSSFLWRGWGLSAELFAVFLLPMSFAYAVDYLKHNKNLGRAIFFNFLLAQAHLGIFYLTLFSYVLFLAFSLKEWKNYAKRLLFYLIIVGFSLAYFIVPFYINGGYRNFSLWDPIWKFDSWGMKQVTIWLLNGALFDFNRFPFITLSVLFGTLIGFANKRSFIRYFSGIFCFYMVLFFGRTTLGGVINLIPGLSEYHLHRIIVMVQFTGVLVGGWVLYEALNRIVSYPMRIRKTLVVLSCIVGIVLVYRMEKPVVKYAEDNNKLIMNGNMLYKQEFQSYSKLLEALKKLPRARIYAGRPGNWGKDFKIGYTQVYMALSRDGFPITGFLPESWSPNSDPEQFFDEDNLDFYRLYNIGYIVIPSDKMSPKFASLVEKEGKYALYKVTTYGWFSFGRSSYIVRSKKTDLLNITRLWFASSLFKSGDYPTIGLYSQPIASKKEIKMEDLNHYNGKNIWETNPFNSSVGQTPFSNWKKEKEETLINGYRVKFTVQDNNCDDCVLILRQSFHPNWHVTVNGKKMSAIPVFPFFIGIPISTKGNFDVVATYIPNKLKIVLVYLEISLLIFIIFRLLHKTKSQFLS